MERFAMYATEMIFVSSLILATDAAPNNCFYASHNSPGVADTARFERNLLAVVHFSCTCSARDLALFARVDNFPLFFWLAQGLDSPPNICVSAHRFS